MAKPQTYTMKWNNYQNHIGGIFLKLLETESMVDLTLCADGEKIHCHRIILSACSPYFQEILSGLPSSNAVVILCGISAEDVKSIIEFVYKGELHVSPEKCPSVLKAAEALKISGLMEVSNLLPALQMDSSKDDETIQEIDISDISDIEAIRAEIKQEMLNAEDGNVVEEERLKFLDPNYLDSSSVTNFQVVADDSEDQSDFSLLIETPALESKKKKRREYSKRDYSEDAISAAIDDLMQGRSLLETANAYSIPRSTLYARARSFGISPTITRQDYSEEKLTAAVETVKGGASLQAASAMYGIPKTVLWRRVQKDIGYYALSRRAKLRQRYLPHAKEAAVRALENGEKFNKVALQYKIPKATLFREKSRLVEAGKLPLSCLNKRVSNKDSFKQLRLRQAVAACKEGRMSQAAASTTFKVSKTTIWRRLQQSEGGKAVKLLEPKSEPEEETMLDFQEVVSEIPVTYGDVREYPSLIILTPNSCGELTYQTAEDLVVDTVFMPDNVENVGEVIEIQETPSGSEEVAFTEVEEIS